MVISGYNWLKSGWQVVKKWLLIHITGTDLFINSGEEIEAESTISLPKSNSEIQVHTSMPLIIIKIKIFAPPQSFECLPNDSPRLARMYGLQNITKTAPSLHPARNWF